MMFARFELQGVEKFGVVEGDSLVEISGSLYGEYRLTGTRFKLEDVKLLAPCVPSKVVAVGLNYADHIKEFGDRPVPENPTIFLKLPHTIIGPEDAIVLPDISTRVDYEAELAVVIKKTCINVEACDIDEYLLGATCLNDVTERNIQRADGQWTRGKNFETFCPIGPYIVNGLDYNSLDIKSFLNGELKQNSNTSNLIWNVQQLVSFISGFMPLYPGDIVTTGTPYGVSPMKDGDVIEVVIEGIGTLKNRVIPNTK